MSAVARRITIILVFVLMIGGGYALSRLWRQRDAVPKEFIEARLQGALIAQSIVDLSNQSVADLGKINQLDSEGKYAEALNLTTDVVKQSQEIRGRAVSLSGQIETMTKALPDIQLPEARQAALEGITSRLALVSRLINYSGYLAELLEALRGRFSGGAVKNHEVARLVDQINAEVRAVNNFNSQAVQAMGRFDTIVRNSR